MDFLWRNKNNSVHNWSDSSVSENSPICSVNEFISEVCGLTKEWVFTNPMAKPWFRGFGDQSWVLKPSIFRESYDEFGMTTMFRNRAPVLGDVPHRDDQDQWLFLMQHYGLPTRLLDWTESALAALFFAVDNTESDSQKTDSAVWIMNPIEFNKRSCFVEIELEDGTDKGALLKMRIEADITLEHEQMFVNKDNKSILPNGQLPDSVFQARERLLELHEGYQGPVFFKRIEYFPNSWAPGKNKVGNNHVQLPFLDKKGAEKHISTHLVSQYPIAVHPSYCDTRQRAQSACFTIHGIDTRGIDEIFTDDSELVREGYLKKLIICKEAIPQINKDLGLLGMTRGTVYPDLSGLAAELKMRYRLESTKG